MITKILQKYDNDLQKEIVYYLNSNDTFFFHGYTGTFFFMTWDKGAKKFPITSKKPNGDNSISATINVFSNIHEEHSKYGVELSISIFLWRFQTDELMFQGWVESLEEFKTVLKAVGL